MASAAWLPVSSGSKVQSIRLFSKREPAQLMAAANRGFRVPCYKYTYASGKGAGVIFMHSPQKSFCPHKKRLILRQINSDAQNKVWITEDPLEFKRCDEALTEEILDDAHGIIMKDGWAQKVQQDESAGSISYKRGNRIWVERSMSPGQDTTDRIPVVDLDALEIFEIDVSQVCFVAQMSWHDEAEHYLAVAIGPIVNLYLPKRKRMAQLFFLWSASEPELGKQYWDVWDKGDKKNPPQKKFDSYSILDDYEERWQIFRWQWAKLNKIGRAEARMRTDEPVSPITASVLESEKAVSPSIRKNYEEDDGKGADRDSTSSESSGELGIHWRPGPINKENCCNISPCPLKPGDADLVPSFIGGLREIEHYHVQDSDTEECPRGAEHKGHCILRNDRTQCVFSHDQVDHVCCKLRINLPLPGVGKGSQGRMLWEQSVSNDCFVDMSEVVRARTEVAPHDSFAAPGQNILDVIRRYPYKNGQTESPDHGPGEGAGTPSQHAGVEPAVDHGVIQQPHQQRYQPGDIQSWLPMQHGQLEYTPIQGVSQAQHTSEVSPMLEPGQHPISEESPQPRQAQVIQGLSQIHQPQQYPYDPQTQQVLLDQSMQRVSQSQYHQLAGQFAPDNSVYASLAGSLPAFFPYQLPGAVPTPAAATFPGGEYPVGAFYTQGAAYDPAQATTHGLANVGVSSAAPFGVDMAAEVAMADPDPAVFVPVGSMAPYANTNSYMNVGVPGDEGSFYVPGGSQWYTADDLYEP